MTPTADTKAMKILYVGDLTWWGTCLQRCRALEELGCQIVSLDMNASVDLARQRSFPARVMRKIGLPLDQAHINQRIIAAMQQQAFDVLWLDKALLIKPATLQTVRAQQPACKIVGYTPDDMSGNRNNQSRYFLQHLPYYDIFFTTKSFGVAELKRMGCPRVVFVNNCFDSHTHHPVELTSEEKARLGGPLGFIGAWERERSDSIMKLAQAGLTVRVWGTGWQRVRGQHANLIIESRDLLGEEYARGICSYDINLCFLRKVNRDLQTTRSIEIPACGAFMLAERTEEHLSLFEEGKEAEYFNSDKELLEKACYYLDHTEERKRIAAAGRQRCLASGYSIHECLKFMLNKIGTHCPL